MLVHVKRFESGLLRIVGNGDLGRLLEVVKIDGGFLEKLKVKTGCVLLVREVCAGVYGSVWRRCFLVGFVAWNWDSGGFYIDFAITAFEDSCWWELCGVKFVENSHGRGGGSQALITICWVESCWSWVALIFKVDKKTNRLDYDQYIQFQLFVLQWPQKFWNCSYC